MAPVVFGGVSPRSLGDLLKGYGLIAALGERYPPTRFWWDDGFHLVAELPAGIDEKTDEELLSAVPEWAESVAEGFARRRQNSCDKPLPCPDHPKATRKGKKKTCPVVLEAKTDSPLKSGDGHDAFPPLLAEAARAVAVPRGERSLNAEPHPWFPGYGQESSGNYFNKLAEAAKAAPKAVCDLEWSLHGLGSQPVKQAIGKGYLFFPEPTKRYATGIEKWEQEKASVTAWCFLLALRGALLLRGGLRRPRWRRAGLPAFPFVFDGGRDAEVHVPTWSREHPRTRNELLLQVRQFHAPLRQGSFAVTAAEFRAAVQRRGQAVGFDAFHRFVVEARRPGRKRQMPQAIPRGLTRVSGPQEDVDLRHMIAPLGESGWVDQFKLPRPQPAKTDYRPYALEARSFLDDAIHGAIDEPGVNSYVGILEHIWRLNCWLLLPSKLRRAFEAHGRRPRPAPPLPAPQWDRALAPALAARPEWRLARALGSIVGVRGDGGRAVGPILEHLLPVQYRWDRATWTPREVASASTAWSGRMALRDFQSLLWRRWLASDGLARLPFAGMRPAPVDDVLRLLRGEVNVHEVHRLTPLFALLGWQSAGPAPTLGAHHSLPVSAGYVALRLWIELGNASARDARPPRDGEVPRLLSLGGVAQVEHAIGRALGRLRVSGLPWHERPAPMGKAVAMARPRVTQTESERTALAVMVPISRADTLALARRLWVAVTEKETSA